MQKITYLFGHLSVPSPLAVGEKVSPGDVIGEMGCSGKSDGVHLHLGCVKGEQTSIFRLEEQVGPIKSFWPDLEAAEIAVFGNELWGGCESKITTYPHDPYYFKTYGKHHPAFDLIPLKKTHTTIHWPRSREGKVTFKGFDTGYGHTVLITMEK